ncbi:hypothetical protein CU312_08350, partial [Prochlorococcus marinus str. MU1406]|nr:hypothetical protein [Prochlorococcus marinus str. MU1406]
KLIPNIYLLNFIMQLISGLLLINVFFSILKEKKTKDNLEKKKFDHYVFIILNYLIILLSKLYTYHIRQYWSCALFIFLFYIISKTKFPKKIFTIKNFTLNCLGVSIHLANIPSFLIINLIMFNRSFIKRIKFINYNFKSNIESKCLFLSVFLILVYIFANYYEPIFIFLVNNLAPKQFSGGYLVPGDLGVSPYEKSSIGFILPILFLLPILIMTNTLPFSNLVSFLNKKREMVFKNINSLSTIIIFISVIEYFSDFYSLGRMKTIIYPLIFYVLFNMPINQLKLSNLKLASLMVFVLSLYTTLKLN